MEEKENSFSSYHFIKNEKCKFVMKLNGPIYKMSNWYLCMADMQSALSLVGWGKISLELVVLCLYSVVFVGICLKNDWIYRIWCEKMCTHSKITCKKCLTNLMYYLLFETNFLFLSYCFVINARVTEPIIRFFPNTLS